MAGWHDGRTPYSKNIGFNSGKNSNCRKTVPELFNGNYRGGGEVSHAIDFDLLKQELSDIIVKEKKERYQFTWPDKTKSKLLANSPTTLTLRPCKEESVDYGSTKNIYIEGDNLEALKMLRKTYFEKIKMIYIDPPYNTSNDFIYFDDFKMNSKQYGSLSGEADQYNNRLIKNVESTGRFHTNWLNMIYPRLKIARDLLSSDGAIFISMDENEITNLKKICDEIFGEKNFVGDVIRKTKSMTADKGEGFNNQHEYLVIYAKALDNVHLVGKSKNLNNYSNPDNDPQGEWCSADPSAKSGSASTYFDIINPYTGKCDYPPKGRYWAFSKETMKEYIASGRIKFKRESKATERGFIFKRYKNNLSSTNDPLCSLLGVENEYMNQGATVEVNTIFDDAVFSYPKPVSFLKEIIKSITTKDDIVLDFFSGSASVADATLQLNSADGLSRKFIMVQLPELCCENSAAFKAGYKNICEIGKERIRRAGLLLKNQEREIDVGFRVFKIDTSNMKDSYFEPNNTAQIKLDDYIDNIKEDRCPEDLLTQVMLELNIELSSSVKIENIDKMKVFNVDDGYLLACFDKGLNENLIRTIAKREPICVAFRNSAWGSDSIACNFEQILKQYSPLTKSFVI